jgi:hypothetical protein
MSAYTDSKAERLNSRWSTVDSFLSNQLRAAHTQLGPDGAHKRLPLTRCAASHMRHITLLALRRGAAHASAGLRLRSTCSTLCFSTVSLAAGAWQLQGRQDSIGDAERAPGACDAGGTVSGRGAHVHVDDGHADQRVQLAEVRPRAPRLRQQRLQRVHCARSVHFLCMRLAAAVMPELQCADRRRAAALPAGASRARSTTRATVLGPDGQGAVQSLCNAWNMLPTHPLAHLTLWHGNCLNYHVDIT